MHSSICNHWQEWAVFPRWCSISKQVLCHRYLAGSALKTTVVRPCQPCCLHSHPFPRKLAVWSGPSSHLLEMFIYFLYPCGVLFSEYYSPRGKQYLIWDPLDRCCSFLVRMKHYSPEFGNFYYFSEEYQLKRVKVKVKSAEYEMIIRFYDFGEAISFFLGNDLLWMKYQEMKRKRWNI